MKVNNNIIDKIISLKLNTLNDLKQKKSLSDLIDEVKNIQQNQFQNNISFTQKIKAKSRGKEYFFCRQYKQWNCVYVRHSILIKLAIKSPNERNFNTFAKQ